MKTNEGNVFDVLVIGAGQAGLSVSYFLKKQNVRHLVFERGKIGESWRSQRWDSFALNTPNFMNVLPGDSYKGDRPDGFMLRDEFSGYLKSYAERFQLPVKEGITVTSAIKRPEQNDFEIVVNNDPESGRFICKQMVIASGLMSAPKTPRISQSFPDDILQLHAASYKNHSQPPAGAVLVVGSGQSGCQIAEDLLSAGRKVFIATSKVGRIPRRYRGKDILEWFILTGFWDVLTKEVTDPSILKSPQPQVSGIGFLGHTVSLQDLHRQGANIHGRLEKVTGHEIVFGNNAADNVRFADEFSENFKKKIDTFILENKMAREDAEVDEADLPDPSASCVDPSLSVNLKEKNITTVIWTTGFTSDFSWITPSVTNKDGIPVHTNGISPLKGVYFLGFPWLKSRKSGIVYGMNEDAQYIAEKISAFHK